MDIVYATLAGGVLGILASVLPHYLQQRAESKRRRKAIAASIAAEISAIREIVALRRYRDGLAAMLNWVKQNKQPCTFKLDISQDYMAVFHSNISEIGSLDSKQAGYVVRFYVQLKALIEDVRPDVPNAKTHEEAEFRLESQVELLDKTMMLGENLTMELEKIAIGS